MPPPEIPGHSWASLGHPLVGSLFLFPGSWCTQGFVCTLQESVSPLLCKFWWLCGGVNGNLLQEGLCHTHVCCTPSPCPCSRPLLIHTSAGDSNTVLAHLSFTDYAKAFDCVDHNKLGNCKKDGNTRPPTCLLRNLYASQEATVRIGHRTTDGSKSGKEYKTVCCHPAYSISMQNTSCKMLD